MNKMDIQFLEFFKDLEFNEEEHKYFLFGKQLKISVSGLVKNFEKKVNFEEIAQRKDIANDLLIGTTSNLWNTKKEVACEKGTKVHLFGELYPFNRHLKPRNKYEEAIVNFWNDIPSHIIPVIVELRMYHKKYLFAGTADIILYNTLTKKFIIADYKTNEDLFKNFNGKTLKAPFEKLLDNPFSKYELQLSFYQILLEQLGIEVYERKIIWLKEDATYSMYNTEDYTVILNEYLKNNEI